MTQEEIKLIGEIETAVKSKGKIPAEQVRCWIDHSSLEVLGAVVNRVIRNSQRVHPALSMEEICNTVQEYYQKCLMENLQTSDYAPNRSVAGYELVSWFTTLWRDPKVPREYLTRLKTMLADLCLTNAVPADQMIGAVLEHLFEDPRIAEFFGDWKGNPILRNAFDGAVEWVDKSPYKSGSFS